MRSWYLIGVAIVAAALSDSLVESCANRGSFGGGVPDTDHTSVIPALIFGLVLIAGACVRAAFAHRHAAAVAGDRMSRTIVQLAACTRARDIVPIVALQIVTVYAMECAEQLRASGHLPDGLSWLGGPVPVSLAIHAIVAIIVAWCAGRALRVLADGVRLIVACALAETRAWTAARPSRLWLLFIAPCSTYASRCRAAFAGGRAPPLLAVS